MNPPLAASWALQQSASDAYSVSRGILEAATSDNIQPIALEACEVFGATLPMSVENGSKVEQLCSQTHKSSIMNFMKCKVGYRKGDSGWQLCQRDAGVRFLSLAACLTSIDHWTAAEAVKSLITEMGMEKRSIPNASQIKDLLGALVERLFYSGFADSVLGWDLWLQKSAGKTHDHQLQPSKTSLIRLIAALSDLARLGNTRFVHIKVRMAEAAWVIAFVKWLTGLPPSIVVPESDVVQEQLGSHVFVYPITREHDIEVSNLDAVDSILDLMSESIRNPLFTGMINFKSYGAHLMTRFGPPESLPHRTAAQHLLYGCYLATRYLNASSSGASDDCEKEADNRARSTTLYHVSMFPANEVFAGVVDEFLGYRPTGTIPPLTEGAQIQNTTDMKTVRDLLTANCVCNRCTGSGNDIAGNFTCEFDNYLANFSYCVATILVVSLFVTDSFIIPVLLNSSGITDKADEFTEAVLESISGGNRVVYDVVKITGWILNLAGCRFKAASQLILAASCGGQTICFEVMGHLQLNRTGLLKVICMPGTLFWKGEPYVLVESLLTEDIYPSEMLPKKETQKTQKTRLTAAALKDSRLSRISWRVEPQEMALKLYLVAPDFPGSPMRSAANGIRNALTFIFVDCRHKDKSDLSTIDDFDDLFLYSSAEPFRESSHPPGIYVIPTGGDAAMQYYAVSSIMGYQRRAVVRGNGCIACCVRVCRAEERRCIVF